MVKRIHFLIFTVIIVSYVPSLCLAQEQQPSVPAQTIDVLPIILGQREIKVGILLNYPPFAFTDENGNVTGFNVDIAAELATALGVELKVVEVKPGVEELINSQGDYDIAISNLVPTPELAKSFEFSEPYFQSGQTVLVNEKNSSINSCDELNVPEKKIAVIKGTPGERIASKVFNKAQISVADDEAEALMMLLRKKVDAFIYDRHFAQYVCLSHPEWKVLPEQLSHDLYCFAIPRVSERNNNSLITWCKFFVWEIKLSKKYMEIFNKWFGPGKALR